MSEEMQQEQEAPKEARTFSQDEVNALVGRTRAEAAERARRQMEAELQQKASNMQQSMSPEQPQAQGQNVDINAIQQQIMENLNRQQQELERKQQQDALRQQVELAASNYMNHMSKGKEKYADFDEVVSRYRPEDFPEMNFLISGIDNASDVIYELHKNEDKLAQMAVLAKEYPQLAEQRLNSLAKSISTNQQAIEQSKQNDIPAPLDRMQPSQVSGNSTDLGVRDLRKQDWLRG
jgi:hypothetical protein